MNTMREQTPDWQAKIDGVPNGKRYRLYENGRPMPFRDFFERLGDAAPFADWYTVLLADFDARAMYWELPPLTTESLGDAAEFVLIEAPALAGLRPDPRPFAEHFDAAAGDVVAFPNLGGDALMVVPCPVFPAAAYPHLAAFLESAPRRQVRALWRLAAASVREQLGDDELWLSTSGGGVAWLHLRLDSRPKYYTHAPYR